MSFERNNPRQFLKYIGIRARITLLSAVIFGATMIVFSLATLNFLELSLEQEFDDALYNYAVDVSDSVSLDRSGDLELEPPQVDQQKMYPFSLGTALIQIRHIRGKILHQEGNFGGWNIPYKAEFEKIKKGQESVFSTVNKLEGLPTAEAESYRVVNFALDDSPKTLLVLQVAVPMRFLESQITNRKIFFAAAIPLLIFFMIFSGYYLTGRALNPVKQMTQKARSIGVGHLLERLPVPEAQDEIQSLAVTLNEMLDRLEKSFASQERFVADASHQLLTPLTMLRAEIEQNHNEYNPESLLQEVDQLTAIVKDMLLLARMDAGIADQKFEQVYLDEVIVDSVARADRFARARNVSVRFDIQNKSSAEVEERPWVKGDVELLGHLFFNLVENAVKYSSSSQVVKVTLEYDQTHQTVMIEDQGPGIPESDIPFIFERFRQGKMPQKGYGLGLAIAYKICTLHSAQLSVVNLHPGCRFLVQIKNF